MVIEQFNRRVKKLEKALNPISSKTAVIIYNPKEPRPKRPQDKEVVFYIPDNGRDKMPKISEAARKELELMVKQRETEKIEKNKLSN
jgi:hypothetical protein